GQLDRPLARLPRWARGAREALDGLPLPDEGRRRIQAPSQSPKGPLPAPRALAGPLLPAAVRDNRQPPAGRGPLRRRLLPALIAHRPRPERASPPPRLAALLRPNQGPHQIPRGPRASLAAGGQQVIERRSRLLSEDAPKHDAELVRLYLRRRSSL